jgi:hypothetical protein
MVVRPCLCVGLAEYREPSRSCRGYANLTSTFGCRLAQVKHQAIGVLLLCAGT